MQAYHPILKKSLRVALRIEATTTGVRVFIPVEGWNQWVTWIRDQVKNYFFSKSETSQVLQLQGELRCGYRMAKVAEYRRFTDVVGSLIVYQCCQCALLYTYWSTCTSKKCWIKNNIYYNKPNYAETTLVDLIFNYYLCDTYSRDMKLLI